MAIQQSIYQDLIDKIWPQLNLYVNEKINGSKRELTYLHKQRLTPVYSPDQKWEGTSANTRFVAADMVAMDSPLPLKKRSTISSANGHLPKIGMSKKMTETDINNLNIMRAQMEAMPDNSNGRKQKYDQMLRRVADDGNACAVGIDERNEYNYLYGISNGIVLVEVLDDNGNNGVGMRVNYGYPASNTFATSVKGDICGDDIDNVIERADTKGVTIQTAMISKTLLNKIRKSRWARELAADYKELVYTDASKLAVPTQKTFLEAFENEYNFSFIVVDRSVLTEKNGKDYPVKPFNPNRIIFLPNASNDGSLVWGTLAEASAPADGVTYSTVDEYKLISRFRTNEPSLMEITKGQAIVLPVIEDVESIFVLDLEAGLEVDNSDSTESGESDANITINGKVYNKAKVITGLKEMGIDIRTNAKDSMVIRKINELSKEDYEAFEAKLPGYVNTESSVKG